MDCPVRPSGEYACRAGTTTPFHFGETLTAELANYKATSTYGKGPEGIDRQQTTDVGSFPANAWGLHDMHGNVWEWCEDRWHDNYRGSPMRWTALVEPQAARGSVERRLLRGGSWCTPWHLPLAGRDTPPDALVWGSASALSPQDCLLNLRPSSPQPFRIFSALFPQLSFSFGAHR